MALNLKPPSLPSIFSSGGASSINHFTAVQQTEASCSYALKDVNYLNTSDSVTYASALIQYCDVVYYRRCQVDHLLSQDEKYAAQLLHSNALCGFESTELVIYILVLFLSLTIIITNIFEMFVIACNKHLRSNTNHIIMSLAASDCFFGLSFLYSTILNILMVRAKLEMNSEKVAQYATVLDNYFTCLLLDGPGLIFASMMSSILTLLTIAIEKYIAIFYPFRYTTLMTKRNVLVMIIVVWTFSSLIALLPLFGWHRFKGICLFVEKMNFSYLVTWASLGAVSTIITTVLYVRIWWMAHKHARQIAARNAIVSMATSSTQTNGTYKQSARGSSIDENLVSQNLTKASSRNPFRGTSFLRARGSKETILLESSSSKPTMKALKTIATILAAFYVFWLPLIFYLLFAYSRYSDLAIYCLAVWAHISGLFNPIVYGYGNKDIRTTTRNVCLFAFRRGRK